MKIATKGCLSQFDDGSLSGFQVKSFVVHERMLILVVHEHAHSSRRRHGVDVIRRVDKQRHRQTWKLYQNAVKYTRS